MLALAPLGPIQWVTTFWTSKIIYSNSILYISTYQNTLCKVRRTHSTLASSNSINTPSLPSIILSHVFLLSKNNIVTSSASSDIGGDVRWPLTHLDLQRRRPWSYSLLWLCFRQKPRWQRSELRQPLPLRGWNNHRRLVMTAAPL